MRPLTLTIEGLRSFRSPVEISFQGRDHLAVVGDTGAGKSSILEAITYALFGRTTFSGHANQEIINDLADHMRVTLRFTIATGTFEVTRALRRNSDRTVGAAKASLTEFGPDGAETRKIEQVRQVNNRIQQVLGLDAEAFLRTVVLPQGQFAKLLVDDDPAARAAILRQVWRTDDLARAGQLADDALPELGQLVGQVTQALDGTPDHPETHLQQLQNAAEQCIEAAKRARDAHRAAATARDTLAEVSGTIEAGKALLQEIGDFDVAAPTAAADEIARSAAIIAGQRATVTEQEKTLRAQLQAVPSDDDGLNHQAIGAARALLNALPSGAETVTKAAARARDEAAEAAANERRVAERAQELQQLDEELAQRENTRQDLEAALTQTEIVLIGAQTLLRDAQQAAAEAAKLEAQARDKTHHTELFRQEMSELHKRDLAEAEQRATAAEDTYHAARRQEAAVAAADSLHPGDDCSICNRPLPPDWQRPILEGLEIARDAHRTAQANLTEVRNKVRDLAIKATMTKNQARQLQHEAAHAWESARTAIDRITPLVGRDEIDPDALPPADELVEPLSTAIATARRRLAAHDTESQRLRERSATAAANLTNARERLENSHAARFRGAKEAEDARRALQTALASLPNQLRLDVALPDRSLDIEEVRLEGLDDAYRALDDRTQELDRRVERRKQLQRQLDQLAEHSQDLDACWTDQVLTPGSQLVTIINSHRDELNGAIALFAMRDVTLLAPASLDDPATLGATVRALHENTESVAQRTRALVEAAQNDADAARQTTARLAVELGVPATDPRAVDPDYMAACTDEKATDADVDARVAERRAGGFARLVVPLIRLRHASDELDLSFKVIKDLSAALKPGAFPKWLTLRRSRALLVHASRLLEQMSCGRYAFAELDDEDIEWRVVDNDSGLARTPASLSGGEQFIASLALALGMVEMMARSGGRLESLWLDEGFGSLDRSNLDAAIDALASVAARGRMVAVLSHVRAVADQVDHVLAVTRDATGSRASWLDPTKRAQLAASDLAGDAADAFSGLLE